MADLRTEQKINAELEGRKNILKAIDSLNEKGLDSAVKRKNVLEDIARLEKELSQLKNKQANFIGKQLPLMNKARELASSFRSEQLDTSKEYTKQSSLSKRLSEQAVKFAETNKKVSMAIGSAVKTRQIDNNLSKAALSTLEQIKDGNLDLNDLSSMQLDKSAAKNEKEEDLIDAINKAVESQEAFLEGTNAIDKATKKLEEGFNKVRAAVTMTAIFGALVGVAKSFGATIDSIGKQFGSLNVMGSEFQESLIDSSVEATALGGGIEDVASITSTLASNFGMNVDQAAELSGKVFDTSKAIGLSADEGANLFGVLTQTANLSADQAEKLAEGAFQLARQAGVAPQAVLKDIASSTEEIAEFTKDGGDNIAEAAVQARQMGLSLQTTAKISKGLLDFENSITNEMEASVMIGKQLNFNRARQLALEGDIAGATKDVVAQLGSEAEFNKLNVLQREALAKSIGVSVSELSKMVGESNKLTLSGAMASSSFEDLLGEEGLSNITALIGKFKALGASLINELGPYLETVIGKFNTFLTEGDGLETVKGMIQGIGKAFQFVAGNLPTVIGLMVALKGITIATTIAQAILAVTKATAATAYGFGFGGVIVAGLLAGLAVKAATSIPKKQTGGRATGMFMAGEGGPELVNVGNNPANVFSAEQTRQLGGGGFGKIESALERLVSLQDINNRQQSNMQLTAGRGEIRVAMEPQFGGEPL